MIQFGASTEEVLERWERGQEGEDSMGLDLDWDFRPLIQGRISWVGHKSSEPRSSHLYTIRAL